MKYIFIPIYVIIRTILRTIMLITEMIFCGLVNVIWMLWNFNNIILINKEDLLDVSGRYDHWTNDNFYYETGLTNNGFLDAFGCHSGGDRKAGN